MIRLCACLPPRVIAHLCNQQVAHELLAAQMLLLLLNKPTDDSVEIAVNLTREVGQHMEDMNGPIAVAVFDQFRNILHESDIDKKGPIYDRSPFPGSQGQVQG